MNKLVEKYAEVLHAIADWQEEFEYYSTYKEEWLPTNAENIIEKIQCNRQIRVKQKTIRIGKFDVPEPERLVPQKGQEYFTPTLQTEDRCFRFVWEDDAQDDKKLRSGLVHLKKESAIEWTDALGSFSKAKP